MGDRHPAGVHRSWHWLSLVETRGGLASGEWLCSAVADHRPGSRHESLSILSSARLAGQSDRERPTLYGQGRIPQAGDLVWIECCAKEQQLGRGKVICAADETSRARPQVFAALVDCRASITPLLKFHLLRSRQVASHMV